MRAFLAAVLSVIAIGVILIAYGMLIPRTALAGSDAYARAIPASERIQLTDDDPYTISRPAAAYPVHNARMMPEPAAFYPSARPAVATRLTAQPARRRAVAERGSSRDWKKTAMVIGGSSAAGAGLGAIFGGGKGALIGAAIGGGASTLFEVARR